MYGTASTSQPLLSGAEQRPAPSSKGAAAKPYLGVPRARLIGVLERRQERLSNCASLPWALLVFIFTCIAVVQHSHTQPAYDVESLLKAVAVDQTDYGSGFLYDVTSANAWLDYFAAPGASDLNGAPLAPADRGAGWINAVMSNRDNGANIPGRANRGRIRDTNLVVGGIRFTQIRRASAPCAVTSIRSLYGLCHAGVSAAAYGDPTKFVNGAIDVSRAFTPSPEDGAKRYGCSNCTFQFWLDVGDIRNVNQDTLIQLDTAGWLDAGTASISVDLAVLNGENGMVGRVELFTEFTSGGSVQNKATISSVPLDPYDQFPALAVIDTFVGMYAVYLLLATLLSSVRFIRAGKALLILSWWSLLDYAATITLFTAMAQYASLTTTMKSLGILPTSLPGDFSTGPSPVGNNIIAATTTFEGFKTTMAVFLIISTARLFYYFSFQPKLAVFTEAVARAFQDIVHFSVVFGAIMTLFGVWAHSMFGSLAPDWHTPMGCLIAVFRFMQYDYDLVIMEMKNQTMADLFFVLALYGVTNLFLWTLVGIILEAYSVVQAEKQKCPGIFDELGDFFAWAWASCKAPATSMRYLSVARDQAAPRAYGPMGGSADTQLPPYGTILAALKQGALSRLDVVTAEALAAALGVTPLAAAYFVAEVMVTPAPSAAAGYVKPLPANLAAALAELERSPDMQRMRSTVFVGVFCGAAPRRARHLSPKKH
jgi:hypothetical protein